MLGSQGKKIKFLITICLFSMILAISSVHAEPIEIIEGTVAALRQNQSANDVMALRNTSDVMLFSVGIEGGVSDIWMKATYNFSDGTDPFIINWWKVNPQTAAPDLAYIGTEFNSNMLGEWTISLWREAWEPGVDTPVSFKTPSLIGAVNPIPFPTSVTLAGNDLTPTISWAVPDGFIPDAYRVNIYDRDTRFQNGQADIIWNTGIDATSTSLTIPEGVLSEGGHYSFNLQLIDLRDEYTEFTNNNAEILRRSSSFFEFTPLFGANVPEVALPTLADGMYNFRIDDVGPDYITFIDPLVAIGYEYAIGAGDPNFASVLLPDVGDGEYTLAYYIDSSLFEVLLKHDIQYFFPTGGVDWFRVTDIETSAGLDPNDVTAFITGLTFVAAGSFTGTMTPITEFVPDGNPVPEPSTILLLAFGLLGVAGVARKRMKK